MATVSAKSATYDATTQKYRVIFENAILVKWDRDSTQLVVEMDKDTVSLSQPQPQLQSQPQPQPHPQPHPHPHQNRSAGNSPTTIAIPRFGMKSTLIIKTPVTSTSKSPRTPIYHSATTNNKSPSPNRPYQALPFSRQYRTPRVCRDI